MKKKLLLSALFLLSPFVLSFLFYNLWEEFEDFESVPVKVGEAETVKGVNEEAFISASSSLIEKESYVTFAPGVIREMYQPEFWLKQCQKPDELLWTEEDIEHWNEKLLEGAGGLIYNIWDKAYEKEGCSFGISVKRAEIKSYPQQEPIWENPEDPYIDENQLTIARMNTPLLIDGQTEDGVFYHVVTFDYEGWTLSENVAVCESRAQWMEAQTMENRLVVTAPRVRLEVTGEILTMGTEMRLLLKSETENIFGEGSDWGCYGVELPVREKDGSYGVRYVTIPEREGISIGYLPFTRENLLKQMFQFLGNSYGWGGMYESVDCSGLVQEVMASFGIWMPRDAGEQRKVPLSRITFTPSMTVEEREAVLNVLQPGDLLYFPGHIMFYLGQAEGKYYVLSSVSSMKNPGSTAEEEMLKVRRVVINTLDMERKSGNPWLMELETAVMFGI